MSTPFPAGQGAPPPRGQGTPPGGQGTPPGGQGTPPGGQDILQPADGTFAAAEERNSALSPMAAPL